MHALINRIPALTYLAGDCFDLPSPAPPPDELAARNERTLRVQGAFGRLSPRQQLLLELRFGLAGGRPLSRQELARHWQSPVSAVRALEHAALAELRHLLPAQDAV